MIALRIVFDRENTAWTEEQDLVVVPLVCPNCRYSGGAHIRLTPVAADAEQQQALGEQETPRRSN